MLPPITVPNLAGHGHDGTAGRPLFWGAYWPVVSTQTVSCVTANISPNHPRWAAAPAKLKVLPTK